MSCVHVSSELRRITSHRSNSKRLASRPSTTTAEATSTGSWYGSGGWLPCYDSMNDFIHDTIQQAYKDLKESEYATFDQMLIAQCKEFKDTLSTAETRVLERLETLKITNTETPLTRLNKLMVENVIINQLINDMIDQAKQLLPQDNKYAATGLVQSPLDIIAALSKIVNMAPIYKESQVLGVPVAVLFSGMCGTAAGQALFRIKNWNDALMDVIKQWGLFLDQPQSFQKDNCWMSEGAQNQWNIDINDSNKCVIGKDDSIWQWPDEANPHWKSWNHWFARDVKKEARPLASPKDDSVVTSCNDGQIFRWRDNIKLSQPFWLKNMPYSLQNIFGPEYAPIYAKMFENGKIFQTILNPYNYHQFWAPVSGTIKLAAVIPGLLCSKTVIPDLDGMTTASCPYLMNVNSRGLLIIDTTGFANIGLVCCVPIGMVDVSSILYDDNVKVGTKVTKGDKVGKFQFGGSSSFAIIFQHCSRFCKTLDFVGESGVIPKDPKPASFDGNGMIVKVGSQIANIKTSPSY